MGITLHLTRDAKEKGLWHPVLPAHAGSAVRLVSLGSRFPAAMAMEGGAGDAPVYQPHGSTNILTFPEAKPRKGKSFWMATTCCLERQPGSGELGRTAKLYTAYNGAEDKS